MGLCSISRPLTHRLRLSRASLIRPVSSVGAAPPSARQLAQEFLVAGDLEGLSEVFARTAIARTLQTEKRLEEAWKAIEPTLGNCQSYALALGALIQQALGHEAEALAPAQRNIARYPTSTEALRAGGAALVRPAP